MSTATQPKEKAPPARSQGTPEVPPARPRGNGADPYLGEIPPELAALDGDLEEEKRDLPTLAEVGRVLPLGFADQNQDLHRDFELVPWNWDLEEELGQLAEENPEMVMPIYVSEVIGMGVARLGKLEVSKMKRSHRRLLVRSLYFTDALYLYVWIRIGALGHNLKLKPFKCGSCRRLIEDYVGDLRTLEVRTFDSIPSRRVELEHGVEYASKRLKVFHVGPIRWSFMESEEAVLKNPAKLRLHTLQQGVTKLEGAPEGPVYLTPDHLRTMQPREVNRLVQEVDQCNGGLVMEVRDRCPRCRAPFAEPINWSHDEFFAPSSH